MIQEHISIFAILAATIALFLWGRWRHDVVALASLLACVFTGLVPFHEAFAGFGHPAVITVACVLVLSYGLQTTGAVDALAHRLLPGSAGLLASSTALIALGALLSAFMNNVGAMALLMPVAIQIASKHELTPGKILMPLSFGTILGGMTTLIGTPPNMIVAGFRAETGMGGFAMFDFTPVGIAVAAIGMLFLIALGRRIVPTRKGAGTETFDTGTYLTEVRVTEDSEAAGQSLRKVEQALMEADAQVVAMVRNEFRVSAPNPRRVLRAGDILIIEAEPESFAAAVSSLGLKLEQEEADRAAQEEADRAAKEDDAESRIEKGEENGSSHDQEAQGRGQARALDDRPGDAGSEGAVTERDGEKTREEEEAKDAASDETVLQELVPLPYSRLLGRSASDIQMRTRYGLNLLAVSRRGRRTIKRLRSTTVRAGDVLLMQGAPEALAAFAAEFGCVPLAPRPISIPNRRQAAIAGVVMALAIGGAAFGLLPAAIAFAAGVCLFMALRVVSPRKVYEAIDWPVIVLLGALIPVAGAMASTGAADLIAQAMLRNVAQGHPVVALALILIVTMTLSDFMNNAATAAVMCPIAISTAEQLGANPDAFLMAVAIGASCAFLTPIGHQNNTLILGPGGFRFGDYWRLGLPMEILVVAVSVPMILLVWPL